MGIGSAYAAVSAYLGFGTLGSGKTMGLAPYGKEDKNIKPFVLDNDMVNSKLFYRVHDGVFLFHMIIYQKNGILKCGMRVHKTCKSSI